MNKFRVVAVAALLAVFSVSTSHAIMGVGVHYGFDFSMNMKDNPQDGLKIPTKGFDMESIPLFQLPSGMSPGEGTLNPLGSADFMYVSRAEFRNSYINLGGKIFVDVIPFINTLELSGNFGIWQYDGAVHYLDVDSLGKMPVADWNDPGKYPYKTQKLTLEELDMSYLGLSGTPYAKLQLDASIRKDVFKLPLDILKINAGAGFTVNFTTPILGSHLVENVQVEKNYNPEEMVNELTSGDSDIGQKIVEKILKELFTPRYGMHIVAGAHIKIPAVPIGLYADGKFMIPFTKFDENGNVTGLGFLLNVGAALQF
jgi:hypothetical protein